MANFLSLFCLSFCGFLLGAETIDIGSFGPVISVEEENMILALKRKLMVLEEDGKIDALKEQWKQKSKDNFKRPKPVAGITTTMTERTFHHDPTLIIERDIKTPNGDYLARKGDRINPLSQIRREKGFLFIKGDAADHVEFAKQHSAQFDVVLVDGSPFDAEAKLMVPVFFDQGGFLTTHYGIKQVPAFLSVDGDKLLIQEVTPNV